MSKLQAARQEEARKRKLYGDAFLDFMGYIRKRDYPKNHKFTKKELKDLSPKDICKWLRHKVASGVAPSSLEIYKSKISYFMPDRLTEWDETSKNGNPTRSKMVKDLMKTIRETNGCTVAKQKKPQPKWQLRQRTPPSKESSAKETRGARKQDKKRKDAEERGVEGKRSKQLKMVRVEDNKGENDEQPSGRNNRPKRISAKDKKAKDGENERRGKGRSKRLGIIDSEVKKRKDDEEQGGTRSKRQRTIDSQVGKVEDEVEGKRRNKRLKMSPTEDKKEKGEEGGRGKRSCKRPSTIDSKDTKSNEQKKKAISKKEQEKNKEVAEEEKKEVAEEEKIQVVEEETEAKRKTRGYLRKNVVESLARKKKKDPLAPKNVMGSYLHFLKEFRTKMSAKDPNMTGPGVCSMAGKRWKELTPEQRKKYEDMSNEDKKRYQREMKIYQEKNDSETDSKHVQYNECKRKTTTKEKRNEAAAKENKRVEQECKTQQRLDRQEEELVPEQQQEVEGQCAVNNGEVAASTRPSCLFVQGAGQAVVNGVYVLDGTFDNAWKYSMLTAQESDNCIFSLFFCGAREHWYISMVPRYCLPGTNSDIDFYSAPMTETSRCLPPKDGWSKCHQGVDPVPNICGIFDANVRNNDTQDEDEDS